MTLTYRYLSPADAAEFRALRLHSFAEEPDAFFFTREEMEPKPLVFWERLLSEGWHIGAFIDGTLAGCASLWQEKGVKIRHRGYLGAVYVGRQLRGKGVARAMIQALLDKGKENGLELVRLSTKENNPVSVGLYKSLGFEPYGVEKHFLKLEDGSYVNEVMMVKYL